MRVKTEGHKVARRLWLAGSVGAFAVDYGLSLGEADGDTFSEVIAHTFRVDTPAGRRIFLVSLGAFGGLFAGHIIK